MKASVLLAHPYRESFNHAIFETVCRVLREKGVEVLSHDLYAERFDPVLTVEELGSDVSCDPLVNRCARELVESDLLFFIHPNWWGQPPAVLKGYIDRVIRPPHAYDFPPGDSGGGLPIGKLAGKRGIVINTSNTVMQRENDYFGDPLERIWGRCVFGFCGIEKYYRRMFTVVADSDADERRRWLEETEGIVDAAVSGGLFGSVRHPLNP